MRVFEFITIEYEKIVHLNFEIGLFRISELQTCSKLTTFPKLQLA